VHRHVSTPQPPDAGYEQPTMPPSVQALEDDGRVGGQGAGLSSWTTSVPAASVAASGREDPAELEPHAVTATAAAKARKP
jgi:hypothetical protein